MSCQSAVASLPKVVIDQIRARPRLAGSTVLGLATFLALSWLASSQPRAQRALVAWDVGAGLYLVLAWHMMLAPDVEKMRERACEQDDGAVAVLALSVGATVASLTAIVFEL